MASAELVKAKRARSQVSALIEPAFVADDFSRIKGRATPRRGLCGMAVEAAATEVLSLFRSGIISMLDM